MNDYLGGQSRDELEAVLRRLIMQGAEGPKVDFKSSLDLDNKAALAELAKDVSCVANTDDIDHLDDFGYLIIGAERGRLLGAPEFAGDVDKLQARITDVIKNFVGPLPQFSVVAFQDPDVGYWGAIVIPPSNQQPHVLTRDGGGGVIKHEWWVRVNDTKERATPHDFARFLAKSVRREVRSLELEVQRLALKVEQQGATSMESLVGALKTSIGSERADATPMPAGSDLAARVRSLLIQGSSAVEDALIAEALSLAEVMNESSDVNPWSFGQRKADELLKIVAYLEDKTFPLAHAIATVARHDRQGRMFEAVERAFSIIAHEPEPSGTHYPNIAQFRLYPVALCLYSLVAVSSNEGNGELLKRVMPLKLVRDRSDAEEPLFAAMRRVRSSTDVFKAATENNSFEAVALRVREAFIPRLSNVFAGTRTTDLFFLTEFVMALSYLSISEQLHEKSPLPGLYIYSWDARRVVKRFLSRKPEWIASALGQPLPELLAEFDRTVGNVVNHRGAPDGFLGGALDAYQGNAK